MDALTTQPKKRKTRAKQSNTVVHTVWGRVLTFVKGRLCGLILIPLFILGACAFHHFYYKKNPHFLVQPEAIRITGNATLPSNYIRTVFDLSEPKNGFELVQSQIVKRLQMMPYLKNAQIFYTQGNDIELWIEERTPLARIAGDIRPPLFVDEEGMLFIYQRASSNYPVIGGFDLPEEMLMPGNRLPESLHCMLRLLQTVSDTKTYFNSAVKRVSQLGMDPDDGLIVTLVDGREITIAWDNMATEKEISEGMMERIRNVSRVLRSSIAEGHRHINAMAPDRVTTSE